MGLVLTMYGVSQLGVVLLTKLFQQLQAATPSCVFYYYLVLSLFMLSMLVVYIILAKRYMQAERKGQAHQHPGHS